MSLKNGKYQIDKWTAPPEYQLEKKLWDGTDIRASQRVGADERMWVRAKLEDMHVFGFLDEATFQARDKAAELAVTREDLNRLISDLPAGEDDWKAARKIPMDRAVLQEAIETRKPKGNWNNIFPLFVLPGLFATLAGCAGFEGHATTSSVVYAALLTFMGIVSFCAGIIIFIRNT